MHYWNEILYQIYFFRVILLYTPGKEKKNTHHCSINSVIENEKKNWKNHETKKIYCVHEITYQEHPVCPPLHDQGRENPTLPRRFIAVVQRHRTGVYVLLAVRVDCFYGRENDYRSIEPRTVTFILCDFLRS